jgi:hypothetical protein
MIIVGTATVRPCGIENHRVLVLGSEALIKSLEVCIERTFPQKIFDLGEILPSKIFDLKEIRRAAPRHFVIVEYLNVTEYLTVIEHLLLDF